MIHVDQLIKLDDGFYNVYLGNTLIDSIRVSNGLIEKLGSNTKYSLEQFKKTFKSYGINKNGQTQRAKDERANQTGATRSN